MSDLKHDKTNNELSFVTQGIKNFQPDFKDVPFLAKWITAAAGEQKRENLAALRMNIGLKYVSDIDVDILLERNWREICKHYF